MKHFYLIPALLTLGISASVLAQATDGQEDNILLQDEHELGATGLRNDFAVADTNVDGVLSIDEAEAALPELLIHDSNNDGMVNQQEVQAILPDLHFAARVDEDGQSLVTAAEYAMIIGILNAHKHP